MAYIYVIYSPNGYAKIGSAKLPFERFGQMRTENPLDVSFEYLCECPDAKAVEAALHLGLADCRHRGEWYAIDAVRAVERVRAIIARDHAMAEVPYARKPLGKQRSVLPKLQEIARA